MAGRGLLYAVQRSGQDASGDMRGFDLVPDDLAAFFFRFDAVFCINGQNVGVTASGRRGRCSGFQSSFAICGFRFIFGGWGVFRIPFQQKRIQSIFTAAVKMRRSAAVQLLQNAVVLRILSRFIGNRGGVCGISGISGIRLIFSNVCCAAHIAGAEIIFWGICQRHFHVVAAGGLRLLLREFFSGFGFHELRGEIVRGRDRFFLGH